MPTPNDIGDRGEAIAAEHLKEIGFRVLEQNYRSGRNEVDLVCEDPNEGGEIVFVEVKTRRGLGYGAPEASITEEKRESLVEVGRAYLHEHELEGHPARFDVVTILLSEKAPEVDHYENAFWTL